MPIEPVKPISDVWNPWPAAQAMIGMQHLGMEQQRLGEMEKKTQLDAAEMIAKNPDVPIMQRYSAVEKIMGSYGVQMSPSAFVDAENLWTSAALITKEKGPDSPEAVEANTKLLQQAPMFRQQMEAFEKRQRSTRELQGYREMGGVVRGQEGPVNENIGEAMRQSPVVQKEVAQAYFPGELESARTALVKEKIKKMQLEEQALTKRQQQLVSLTNPTFTKLDSEESYRKGLPLANVDDTGMEGPLRNLGKKQLDLDARAIEAGTLTKDERAQAATRVEGELYQLNTARQQLQAQLRNANALAGTTHAVNIDEVQGQLEAIGEAVKLKSAELPYLKNAFDRKAFTTMKAAYQAYDKKILTNKQEIMNLRNQQLGISQGALDEKKLEYQNKEAYAARLRTAGEGILGDIGYEATAGDVAKYAKDNDVSPKDLQDMLKDPSKTGQIHVQIAAPGERKELSEGRAALRGISQVETLYSDKFVGKIDNLLAKWKGPLNLLTPEEAEFRAAVKKQAAALRKLYAGTAQSKQELITLIDSIPDTDQSETNFKASIKATKENVKRINEEIVATGEEVGVKMPRATPSLSPKQRSAMEQLKKDNPDAPEEMIRGFVEKLAR